MNTQTRRFFALFYLRHFRRYRALCARPVGTLTCAELARWRDFYHARYQEVRHAQT